MYIPIMGCTTLVVMPFAIRGQSTANQLEADSPYTPSIVLPPLSFLLLQFDTEEESAMPAQQDRPNVELSVTNEFIIAQWGPAAGPYGIFNETMVAAPETVTIKEWWLFVGTKARPNETHEPPDHQSVQNDIVFQKMGTATELK